MIMIKIVKFTSSKNEKIIVRKYLPRFDLIMKELEHHLKI
jgi:hypothetical protein